MTSRQAKRNCRNRNGGLIPSRVVVVTSILLVVGLVEVPKVAGFEVVNGDLKSLRVELAKLQPRLGSAGE